MPELTWRKSSYSGTGNCIEVRHIRGGDILIRHSRDGDRPILWVTRAEWEAFIAGVKDGEFDHA